MIGEEKGGSEVDFRRSYNDGGHCIRTWGSTQGTVAFSSAEAELYAMVTAVLKAKWLVTVSREMGFEVERSKIVLGTDSEAAKSFVSRRGLGKMRHIEVRDLWLQKEVLKGNVKVEKIPGTENPADLMTKYLGTQDIRRRLKGMNLELAEGNKIKNNVETLVPGRWADEDESNVEGLVGAMEVVRWWQGIEASAKQKLAKSAEAWSRSGRGGVKTSE